MLVEYRVPDESKRDGEKDYTVDLSGKKPRLGMREVTADSARALRVAAKDGLLEEFTVARTRRNFRTGEDEPDGVWGPFHRVSEKGRAFAAGPEPEITPVIPALGDKEWSILRSLAAINTDEWASPLWVGGGNGTHHSESMYRLTLHGYLEMRKYWGDVVTGAAAWPKPRIYPRGKGSRRFRITEAGKAALAARGEASHAD